MKSIQTKMCKYPLHVALLPSNLLPYPNYHVANQKPCLLFRFQVTDLIIMVTISCSLSRSCVRLIRNRTLLIRFGDTSSPNSREIPPKRANSTIRCNKKQINGHPQKNGWFPRLITEVCIHVEINSNRLHLRFLSWPDYNAFPSIFGAFFCFDLL